MFPYKALFLYALLFATMVSGDGDCVLLCGYNDGEILCFKACNNRMKSRTGSISEDFDRKNSANSEYTKFGVPIISGPPPHSFHTLFTLPTEDGGYTLVKPKPYDP